MAQRQAGWDEEEKKERMYSTMDRIHVKTNESYNIWFSSDSKSWYGKV